MAGDSFVMRFVSPFCLQQNLLNRNFLLTHIGNFVVTFACVLVTRPAKGVANGVDGGGGGGGDDIVACGEDSTM